MTLGDRLLTKKDNVYPLYATIPKSKFESVSCIDKCILTLMLANIKAATSLINRIFSEGFIQQLETANKIFTS